MVVAGLGDSGLLTAIHLSRHADVVGISAKPGLVSGQELGMRLTRPDEWAREYWSRSTATAGSTASAPCTAPSPGSRLDDREVRVRLPDGTHPHRAVRRAGHRDRGHQRVLAPAGPAVRRRGRRGPAGHHTTGSRPPTRSSSSAAGRRRSAARPTSPLAWPDKRVDLYFPGDRALPQHHPRVWATVSAARLTAGSAAPGPSRRSSRRASTSTGSPATRSRGAPASSR